MYKILKWLELKKLCVKFYFVLVMLQMTFIIINILGILVLNVLGYISLEVIDDM